LPPTGRAWNMNDRLYYQYAFTQSDCPVAEIGSGVDPRFPVELIRDSPIAAVASRIGPDQFDLTRLQGESPEDIEWLGRVAARHNEIICQAAQSSAVLPLRMGTVFNSRDSLQAALGCHRATVAEFLRQLADRQEWGIKLYQGKSCVKKKAKPVAPLNPAAEKSGSAYLARRKSELHSQREFRTDIQQTIQAVERRLAEQADQHCRIRSLPRNLTGRDEEMIFNAAFLLPSSMLKKWTETAEGLKHEVKRKGLLLERSGPWPSYHFCPNLEL
jgi:hypothetical protein